MSELGYRGRAGWFRAAGVVLVVSLAAGFGPASASAEAQTIPDRGAIGSAAEVALPDVHESTGSADPQSRPALIDRRARRLNKRFETELAKSRADSVRDIQRQQGLVLWQFALVLAGLALVVWQNRTPAMGRRARRAKRVAWALLALVSIASFYRFSWNDRNPYNMQIKDAYHYYIGGKYFAEIGYGRLYDCTIAAADEQGLWWVDRLDTIRDLQTMSARPAAEITRRASDECRSRFSAQRWSEFVSDLGWFFDRMSGPVWRWMLNDHGFNPSPIWTLLASPLTSATTVEDLPLLVQVDTLLVLAALASIGWAFGFEAMCLAAVVWGTGFMWRYSWVGDAFLRQIWFSSAIIGVCCLRRGHAFVAGGLLAVSAGVRLFPAVFIGGYALFAIRRYWETRVWSTEDRRFAAGASIAAVLLVAASLAMSGRGVEDYLRFAHNTTVLRAVIIKNFAGFEALLWRIDGTTSLYWRNEIGPGWISLGLSKAIRLGVAAGCILWFGAVVRRVESWEAAALGFALIPLLTSPPGYYFHFVVLAVPLSVHRPWVAVWLLLACAAWQVNGFHWRDLGETFTVASVIAVSLCCAVLISMRRPVQAS